MKRSLILSLCVMLAAVLSIGSTIAYLTSTDSAVNTMTVGNVKIEQNEHQRKEDDKTELEEFDQNKPLLPATGEAAWADESKWPVPDGYKPSEDADGNEWRVFDDEKLSNVVDKFVTVTNTGKSEAYVRTIIAVETPEGFDPEDMIWINDNSTCPGVKFYDIGYITVGGVRYDVVEYIYLDPLASGDTTIPSLKQLYLHKNATNEICEAFGETADVLVFSQAVQAAGFNNAEEALDTAFGDITTTNHPWKDANVVVSFSSGTHEVDEHIIASGDDTDAVTASGSAVINIRGGYYDGGVGDEHTAVWAKDDAVVNIYDGRFTVSGEGANQGYNDVIYARDNAVINIYGGFFEGPARDNDGVRFVLNLKDNTSARINVYGGTFVNFDPSNTGTEPAGADDNFVADGYKVVSEKQETGDVWYTVVKA